jgi:FtsP/CotA-like multicopper oxidase with cupredoxin domain/DNA-binding beta-propeller fold protein YncE
MKRTQTILITTVMLSIALTSVFAIGHENEITPLETSIPFSAEAAGPDHEITMEAVAMPDGLYAYRMVEYMKGGEDLVGKVYSGDPSIPGPTIILTEGDTAKITLINSVCEDKFVDGPPHPLLGDDQSITRSETSMVGMHVHGVHYDITDDASYGRMNMNDDSGALCGESIIYEWVAEQGTTGAWPYHDHTFSINEIGAEELGLFGTLIINPSNGRVNGFVDDNGQIDSVSLKEIEKEFVLWMVSSEVLGRSIFYGNEIDYSTTQYGDGDIGMRETALWTNPNLVTKEGQKYRFHVIGLGDDIHAFHLHGHRWTEDIHEKANVEDVIDVKEITPLQRHSFVIEASDNESADITHDDSEGWMYHCHVLDHMKEGMRGKMTVLPDYAENDNLPIVGAVFTLSDEPGLWMKTLNAGNLDKYDNYLNAAESAFTATNGTGFAPKYLGVLEPGFADTEMRSVAVINPGETVIFGMKDSQTKHTITTLIYPEEAERIGGNGILRAADIGHYDQQMGIRGTAILSDDSGKPVGLDTPGLYVFVCKIHPYMFGAVVVDDPTTFVTMGEYGDAPLPLLDLSPKLEILTRHTSDTNGDGILNGSDNVAFPIQVPTATDVPLTLLKTFSIIVDPSNWKDYTQEDWTVSMIPGLFTTNNNSTIVSLMTPAQTVYAANLIGLQNSTGGDDYEVVMADLSGTVEDIDDRIDNPSNFGIGEVWINTQFETTVSKNFEGTPFDKPGTITVVNVGNWNVERKIALPEINMNHPHNMWTDAKNEVIYQTQWFGKEMAIIDRESGELIKEVYAGQSPSHVMTSPTTDKIYIAVNGEETVNEFDPETYEMTRQISMGWRSHPHGHWISESGKYMVTPDFIGLKASITNLEDEPPTVTNSTLLLGPIATGMKEDTAFYTADFLGNTNTVIDPSDGVKYTTLDWLDWGAGLPIQTPVSPDGKYMVTALTLGGKIGIVNTQDANPANHYIATTLDCDPGCHGVQWGAKEGGGYYAYVSNKFSNALIVVDPDPDGAGTGADDGSNAAEVGAILLADRSAPNDNPIIGYDGMGGQGILAIPNVYDGWVDNLPSYWQDRIPDHLDP